MQTESIRMNIDTASFDKMFESNFTSESTYKSAYEAAEREHEKLTGHRRYSDHDSYRVSRNRRLKKKK